jgi:dolichol-phosphate mannosyltransferase
VLAVVSGVSVLLGVQLVMFGVLSDLIVTVSREQTRQFEQLTRELTAEENDAAAEPGDGFAPDGEPEAAGADGEERVRSS